MNPKRFVALKKGEVKQLGRQRSQVMCALAEAVIDEKFAETIGGGPSQQQKQKGFHEFVTDLDDFLSHLAQGTVSQMKLALKFLEVRSLRHLLLVKVGDRDFSKLDLPGRRAVLEALRSGKNRQLQLYTGVVRLVAAFYFGHNRVGTEIAYEGASVEDQQVLCDHRWRPNDPTPVEPCNGVDPCDG